MRWHLQIVMLLPVVMTILCPQRVYGESGTVEGRTLWWTNTADGSCNGTGSDVQVRAPTLDAAGAWLAATKVSAANCSQGLVWHYDYVEAQLDRPAPMDAYRIIGRSHYDGTVGQIGYVQLITECPIETFTARRSCDYSCPANQTWQGDQCAPRCPFDSSPDGVCTARNNGSQSAACNGSNPINGATGNKLAVETDYVSAAAYPLTWRRVYNSLAPQLSPLGPGWRGSYHRQLNNFNADATQLTSVAR